VAAFAQTYTSLRWKSKYTRADFLNGTTRLKRVFAWLPTYINGTIVFLETYEILQSYQITTHLVKLNVSEKDKELTEFFTGKWIDVSKRLLE